MGKIIKKRVEYGGSSNSAENIKYDDTKNVKEAINEVGNLLGNTDISAIGDGTVTGGLNALNSNLSTKFKTIEIQCTSGSTKFGDFYYGDFNIEPYINSYGKVISAIPISATNNDCFSAYCFSNSIRVLTLSPNSTAIIRITHSKTS